MIYGLALAVALPDRSLEEALKDYKSLTELVKLQSLELDLSSPALCAPPFRYAPRVLPWEIDEKLETNLEVFVKPYKIKGAHLPWGNTGVYSISENSHVQQESRHRIKLGIKKAAELGLDYVVIHAEDRMTGITRDEQYRLFKDAIFEYLSCAETCGIVLTIENTPDIHNLTLVELISMIKEIESPHFKATLDIGHAYLPIRNTTYKRIDKFIELEAKVLGNIHIHDHNLQRDHLPIGKGVIDFPSIIKSLKKINYEGSIILETGGNSQDIADMIERLRSYEQWECDE